MKSPMFALLLVVVAASGCGDRSPGSGRLAPGRVVVTVPGPAGPVSSVIADPPSGPDPAFGAHAPYVAVGVRCVVVDDSRPDDPPPSAPGGRTVLVRVTEGEHAEKALRIYRCFLRPVD